MTDTIGVEAAATTVQPVAELFTSAASALWATTYNMDLALFNDRRAGRPPAHRRWP